MRRFFSAFSLTGFVVLLALGSCSMPLNSSSTGSITISVSPETRPRTVMPAGASVAIVDYSVSGTGPAGATYPKAHQAGSTFTLRGLLAGDWSFTVEGKNAAGATVASGNTTVTITKGGSVSAEIRMASLGGTGTFHLNLDWATTFGITSINGTLTPAGITTATPFTAVLGGSGTTASYSNATLASGSYALVIKATRSSGVAATAIYALSVFQGLTSTLNLSPTDLASWSWMAEATSRIQGVVQSYATGSPIAGATVSVGPNSAQTLGDGTFTLNTGGLSGRLVLNVTKAGFAETSRILLDGAAVTQVPIQMLPVSGAFVVNNAVPQTLVVAGSTATVALPANSLQTGSGTVASGSITANVTVINPLSAPDTMPGDYSTTNSQSIESFGGMNVTFTDSAGSALNLKSGNNSTIRIPIPSGSASPPPTIPLFYYNTNTGQWVEEGTATLAGSAPNQYYEGTVTHFSTWNADKVYNRTTIKGFVKDQSAGAIVGATVVATGASYNGTNSTVTTADGSFIVYAKAGSSVLIKASKNGRSSNTVSVATGASGTTYTMASPLIISDSSMVTIRLTWGADPRDLDSHLTGPVEGSTSRFHMYYGSRGSLTASPFAALDVDDTSGFGPEVTTLTRLIPGTYRYSVHHYAGVSTIAASSARVELNLNGTTQVFTPPSGATTSYWTLFEIVVPTSGTPSVTNLNTIGTTSSYNVAQNRFLSDQKPPMESEQLQGF